MIRSYFVIILFICSATSRVIAGDTIKNVHYGIELNQFHTGSGYASATELLVTVSEGRRSFNIGFYYCPEVSRITGIIAHHEVQLLRNPAARMLNPFVFYNGIARLTRIEDIDEIIPNSISPGIYKTFEHHVGFGLRSRISKSIYFSGSAGYGIYFSSVKKPIILPVTNEIAGSNGFAPLVKIGFGIVL